MKAVKIEAPTISERLDPTTFLEIQQKKIFAKITKLFSGTVYENKLIAQAKKILRDWKRSEADAQKMKYKLESEKEALQDKLDRQVKNLALLESLQIDNKDLQKQLSNALIENQILKKNLAPEKFKV